jgi:hypothetical protein
MCSDVVALLIERLALQHEYLRGIEDGAAVVQEVLGVRGRGGERERKLLRRLLPLLGLLVIKALLVVLLALLRQHRYRRGEQDCGHEERGRGAHEF